MNSYVSHCHFVLIIIVIAIILIGGCVQQVNVQINDANESDAEIQAPAQEVERQTDEPSQRFGNFCIGEEECIDFCLNNRGRCEEYCKDDDSELCNIIFPPREEIEQLEKPQEMKPVLKNLGIDIASWNKATNRAGAFLFENKNYVDGKIFTEFAHKIVNEYGEKLLPEIGFNVPVGTNVVSPIDGVITDVTFYEPSQDYLISLKMDNSSPWIVGFEHVYHLRIQVGDKIIAGQELAEVSPSYGRIEFGNVEINVWVGGQNIIKYCPFEFLDESLKPPYKEKINRLAQDWEEFIGKDVYKQEDWVAPGCLLHNLTER